MEKYMNANRGRLGVPPNISFAACTDPPYTALFYDMVRSYDDLVGALLDTGECGRGQGMIGCLRELLLLPAPALTTVGRLRPLYLLAAKRYPATNNMACLPACLICAGVPVMVYTGEDDFICNWMGTCFRLLA
jgi:hypothetical protein